MLGIAASFHDESSRFTFECQFTENYPGPLDFRLLWDRALRVESGRGRAGHFPGRMHFAVGDQPLSRLA